MIKNNITCNKAVNEDRELVSKKFIEKRDALADYLEVNKDDVRYDAYDNFIVSDGDSYLVYSDDEADKAAKDSVIDILDDVGIESFTQDFKNEILDDEYIDVDWFDDAMKESYESYVSDIESESGDHGNRLIDELLDNEIISEDDLDEDGNLLDSVDLEDAKDKYVTQLCDEWKNGVEWYIDNFGEEEFYRVVDQNGLIDYDSVAEEAIKWDGRGHFLSSWDGKELEIGNDLFAYKQNEGEDFDSAKEIYSESLDSWSNTNYNDLFAGFLDLIEFDLVKVDDDFKDQLKRSLGDDYDEESVGKYALYDRQGANLGDIDKDTFNNASEIFERLDIYIDDYLLRTIDEIAEESDLDLPDGLYSAEDFANWYKKHKDEPKVKEVFGDSDWDFKVLDMIANHSDEIDLDKVYSRYFKESLNESEGSTSKGHKFSDFLKAKKVLASIVKEETGNGLNDFNFEEIAGLVNKKGTDFYKYFDTYVDVATDALKKNHPYIDKQTKYSHTYDVLDSYSEDEIDSAVRSMFKESLSANIAESRNKTVVKEDTIKLKNGKWANVGDDGKRDSGKFKTKKAADAQRKAMFANGYKGESLEEDKEESVFGYKIKNNMTGESFVIFSMDEESLKEHLKDAILVIKTEWDKDVFDGEKLMDDLMKIGILFASDTEYDNMDKLDDSDTYDKVYHDGKEYKVNYIGKERVRF